MTRLQLLKTIVAIRLMARGEWIPAIWLLSIRQKQRGRIRAVPEWIVKMFYAGVHPQFHLRIPAPYKIGDTIVIRRPVRFGAIA